MQQMLVSTVLIFVAAPAVLVGGQYTQIGDEGEVLKVEGDNLASYKEDCTANLYDTCFQTTPTLGACSSACSDHPACNSLAFCTGNSKAPFPRCYLKSKEVDMATVAHGGGDCSTYKGSGDLLASLGKVARTEGANLASYKEDCTDGNLDSCYKTTPTLDSCKSACGSQGGCKSFAYCTGNTDAPFTRCYLKTADFDTVAHGGGDCSSYYPTA